MLPNSKKKSCKFKSDFFISKFFLILLALILSAICIFIWKAQEALYLKNLYTETITKARLYSGEMELKYNTIYSSIGKLAGKEIDPDREKTDKWENDAAVYMSTYQEIEKILLVDSNMQIRRALPVVGNEFLINKSAIEEIAGTSEIRIWQPVYDKNELKGFILGIINSKEFISPILIETEKEYMFKLTNKNNTVFASDNWALHRQEFTVNKTITLQNTEVWNISIAPAPEFIQHRIAVSGNILIFSLSICFIALLSVYFAQMNFKKSKLLSMKQEQLVAYQNRLIAANKELESFSYSVSHDLRAPLRHIAGFVELLKSHLPTDSDEKTRHYMSVISNAAASMGELIDNLLSFSRMGRVDLIYRKVNSNILIDEVILNFTPDTKGRSIKWNITKLPEVKADPDIIKLVYENLISNALKFTRSRATAKIEIGSMPDAQNTKYIIIYVKDNGVGFDMQYKDKLFTIFQRLHSQKDYEGTGVGLANVQRIIQRHGGTVWAEGIPDEGAAFYFTLPKYEGD